MASRSRKTQELGALAARVLRRADTQGKGKRAGAVNAWQAVAGDGIVAHTRGFALRDDGEMVVFVDSSSWANELSLMSEDLVSRLNAHLGEEAVRSLRFTVSKRVKEGLDAAPEPQAGASPEADWPDPVALDEIEVAQTSRVASVIKDEALREAALSAMRRDLELKKGARENGSSKRPKRASRKGREEGL